MLSRGVDLDPERVKLAEKLGYPSVQRTDAESFFAERSENCGWDIVLICADTPSSDPVELAGKIARDRGTGDRHRRFRFGYAP